MLYSQYARNIAHNRTVRTVQLCAVVQTTFSETQPAYTLYIYTTPVADDDADGPTDAEAQCKRLDV